MTRAVPPAMRVWVEACTGGRVVRVRRLVGGITSDIHQLVLAAPNGHRRSVVLRRWAGADATARADSLAREGLALRHLENTALPTPRLVAISNGTETGVPALLMTLVPGRVDLAPADPERAMRAMAEALCAVHQVRIDLPRYAPNPRPHPDDVPSWAVRRDVWRAALSVLREPPPPTPTCFAHGDFQHFNLLWQRGRLTGVVDWAEPVVASPDLDVAHCRLNLTILHGFDRAEAFRLAYEAEAGRRVEPWWDLQRLTDYGPDWQAFIPRQVAGRAPVDVAGMTGRIEEAMAAALARL